MFLCDLHDLVFWEGGHFPRHSLVWKSQRKRIWRAIPSSSNPLKGTETRYVSRDSASKIFWSPAFGSTLEVVLTWIRLWGLGGMIPQCVRIEFGFGGVCFISKLNQSLCLLSFISSIHRCQHLSFDDNFATKEMWRRKLSWIIGWSEDLARKEEMRIPIVGSG